MNENRNGFIVGITATEANGTAERTAALEMVGADKGYNSGEFFLELETRSIEPHVPLVQAPRDPKQVKDQKQKAGVEAQQRMKERQGSDGYRLSRSAARRSRRCSVG